MNQLVTQCSENSDKAGFVVLSDQRFKPKRFRLAPERSCDSGEKDVGGFALKK